MDKLPNSVEFCFFKCSKFVSLSFNTIIRTFIVCICTCLLYLSTQNHSQTRMHMHRPNYSLLYKLY